MKPYSDNKLCKDIIMICKWRYDVDKYPTLLSAFDAYYHKHYSGCDDIQMTYKFAIKLFLYPAAMALLNSDRVYDFLKNIMLYESYAETFNHTTDFNHVLFERLALWIATAPTQFINPQTCTIEWVVDLSEYGDQDIEI